jgi:DNA-binding response OmpR family regulator
VSQQTDVEPVVTMGVEMSGSDGTILIAEDESMIRGLIVDALTEAGYTVIEASNGTEALALLDRPDHVTLIVTDINMPGLNGIDMARAVRRDKPDLPILFASARGDLLGDSDLARPYNVISKPFRLDELVRRVQALLERS